MYRHRTKASWILGILLCKTALTDSHRTCAPKKVRISETSEALIYSRKKYFIYKIGVVRGDTHQGVDIINYCAQGPSGISLLILITLVTTKVESKSAATVAVSDLAKKPSNSTYTGSYGFSKPRLL